MRPESGTSPGGPIADVARPEPSLVVTLDSSTLSVRAALAEMRAGLAELVLASDAAGTVELVLAEVMNNICEHAYGDASGGRIELAVWNEGDVLAFETRDYGLPMPNGKLPAGLPVPIDRPLDELPEGGFGWYLIRHLTSDLSYARVGHRNELTFRMRRDAQPIGTR